MKPNWNMVISQLRRATHDLGYMEGRFDAVRDFMDANQYASDRDIRAVLGIQKVEPLPEVKDDVENALGYTD